MGIRRCLPMAVLPLIPSLLLLVPLIGAGPAAGAERLERIPPAFQGTWRSEPAPCRATVSDESQLRIDADSLRFHESSGRVVSVVQRGLHQIGVIAELSGEGESWLHVSRLTLEPSGDRLAVEVAGAAGVLTRFRCSGAPGTRA